MAKKKEKRVNACMAIIEGGPHHGQESRIVFPPPPYFRLAIPEWATYVLDGQISQPVKNQLAVFRFTYTGPEPPPQELIDQMRHF